MKPDFNVMLRAKADVDRHLNQVLILVAPTNEGETISAALGGGLVEFHLNQARRAIQLFEDACHAQTGKA